VRQRQRERERREREREGGREGEREQHHFCHNPLCPSILKSWLKFKGNGHPLYTS
jgi:hypothetical protein